jgi:hypothetical protein
MKKIVLAFVAVATLTACPTPTPLTTKLWMVTKDNNDGNITGRLFELDVVTPSADREVAQVQDSATNTALDMFDIAWNGTNLYGVHAGNKFYRVRTDTGKAVFIKTLDEGVNALAFDNDGQLWGMGNNLFKISKDTGTMTKINTAPLTYFPSGDIVFSSDNKLFVSAGVSNENDKWVRVDTTNGTTTLIGDMGKKDVWGLARIGNTIYGGTLAGQLLTINTSTGETTVLRTLPVNIGSLNNPVQNR